MDDDDEDDWPMDDLRVCYKCGKRSYASKYCLNKWCARALIMQVVRGWLF